MEPSCRSDGLKKTIKIVSLPQITIPSVPTLYEYPFFLKYLIHEPTGA
ncbi:2181_t:CDS:2, partial [Gigaspora rosea]